MDDDDVTPVDRYLVELGDALRGPRREKRDLVSEARDHLADAAQARVDNGATRHDAEVQAVRDFGPVRDIAPAYQAVLSAGWCRRISIWLIALVFAQPLAWDVFGSLPVTHDAHDHPSALYRGADAYVEVVGSTSALLALVVLVAGRFAFRRLGVREWMLRLVLTASLASAGLLLLISTAMLVSSGELAVLNVAFAAVVSWLPMVLFCAACVRALRAIDLTAADDAQVSSSAA